MSLVGELILSFRELATDLPVGKFPVPVAGDLPALSVISSANPLPAATFFIVFTSVTPFGETQISAEQNIVVGAGQAIQFTTNYAVKATSMRAYFGTAPGAETQYVQFNSVPFTFDSTVPSTYVPPPTRSTAYIPDSDGTALGVFAAYRWLNQALAWAAAKNRGGLPDFGAVGTIGGRGNYVMNGYWKKIDNAWYDGYPLGLLSKNNVFRRNPVTGYSGMLSIFQATDRLMVECWPQPSRTSGQTTLAAPMTATDTTATLTSAAGFVLGFGMVQIGAELVYYSAISGNTLTGLLRGMCGTVPAAQASSTAVTELNLLVSGYRVPSTYSVGQMLSTLYLPPGWDEAITSYMVYRFRKAEQDEAGAKAALSEATQKLSDLSANRIIAGPRQIQPFGSQGPEIAIGLGSPFGGVIMR